ncbi:hypothetical protein CSUB01_02288 [Colletotrichum sublineola]|uniref:Uncharacterized protein n=1 Tax=Colletotrichum sublineola TaxID=1173701 RepID=A0A066X7G8_COLSU|nr:hypothetical protein CSUB01_02288 [Colletotrichum sublineola]
MSFRNFLPIVVAVVTGVGISTYTLKPALEEQKRLRESKEQPPRTFPLRESNIPNSQTPNQTTPGSGADADRSWRKP